MMYVILGVGVSIAFALIYAVYYQRAQLHELRSQLAEQDKAINEVLRNHPILVNADLVFSRQIHELNSHLLSVDNQLQELANTRNNDGGYQHALKILEMGGDKEEIVSSCHLSNAEAELLMNLHAYRAAIKS